MPGGLVAATAVTTGGLVGALKSWIILVSITPPIKVEATPVLVAGVVCACNSLWLNVKRDKDKTAE